MKFEYGPYGEIIPLPLIDGLTPEEAWEQAGLGAVPGELPNA